MSSNFGTFSWEGGDDSFVSNSSDQSMASQHMPPPPPPHNSNGSGPVGSMFGMTLGSGQAFGPPPNGHGPPQPTPTSRFTVFASLLELDNEHRSKALELIAAIRPGDEFLATMAYISFTSQQILARINIQAANTPWVPSEILRDFVRSKAGVFIIGADIQAYSATHDSSKRVIAISFERKMMRYLQDRPAEWRAEFLPASFGSTEHGSRGNRQVLAWMKDILKYCRSGFRTLLLTGVLGAGEDESVPTIKALVALIVRHYINPDDLQSDDQIFAATPVEQRLRIGMLRMIAVHVYACPPSNRRKSQWDEIDAQVSHLGAEDEARATAFFTLLMRQDRELFTGGRPYSLLRIETDFEVPTADSVTAFINDPINIQANPNSA